MGQARTERACTAAWTAALALACTSERAPDPPAAGQVGATADSLTAPSNGRMPAGGVDEGEMRPVFIDRLSLQAGRSVRIETRNCSPGTNPVLHLVDSDLREVAMDDNTGGGVNARIVYTPPSTGLRWVILRPVTNFSRGRCDLYVNDAFMTGAAVGGAMVLVENPRAGEQLETVELPREGSARPHDMFLFAPDGHIAAWRSGGGTGRAVRATVATASGLLTVMLNTPGRSYRLVRNDTVAGHDPDADGLGSELELAIGTCSQRRGLAGSFDCGFAADARDTDGDGLADFWELLGKRDGVPHQLLPTWGANPRHKDVFVEVDFRQSAPDTPDQRLSPARAHEVAAVYAAEVGNLDAARRARVAHVLRNPDGLPGIRLHLDTGVRPSGPDEDGLFGDWGGHSLVPPVREGDGWRERNEWEGFRDYLVPARRGVFRYLLGYPTGGGTCGEGVPTCAVPMDNSTIIVHEFGHTFALGHSGPSWGDTADPNCKPHYASVMNYSFLEAAVGFSDAAGPKLLDPTRLGERANGLMSDGLLDYLATRFRFNVDRANRHVDWNRDGIFQTGFVRAYVNHSPGPDGCEWTRYGQMQVAEGAVAGSPALARLGRTVYALYRTTADRIGYAYTHSTLSCPGPEPGCNGATWTVGAPLGSGVRAMDAVAINDRLPGMILVVGADAAGALYERKLVQWGSGTGQLVEIGGMPLALGGSAAAGEVSLARLGDGRVMLAYKAAADGRLRTRLRQDTIWGPEVLAQAAAGGALPALRPAASPALAWVKLPTDGATAVDQLTEGLHAALAHDITLELYRHDPATGRWRPISPWENPDARFTDVAGKPAMAFVPGNVGAGQAPRFYLHLREAGGVVYTMTSYVRGVAPAASHVVGLRSLFDNAWFTAAGHALLFEPAFDTSLRALSVLPDGRLDFRPKADGSTAHKLINWNDWEVLGNQTCLTTVSSSEGANPLRCHAWKWSPGRYGGELRWRAQAHLCLHKQNDDWNNGNPIFLRDCEEGGEQMKTWIWDRASGQIRAQHNEALCWHKERLDDQAGQRIHLWRCLEGAAAQKSWDYEQDTGFIRNRFSPGVCIVKPPGTGGSGVATVLGPCPAAADPNARWEL